MRISAARFPAHLHDMSPPEDEDCTVSRPWLRFAYLVPGAAGLAVLLVETTVSRRVAAVLTYLHDVNSPTTP